MKVTRKEQVAELIEALAALREAELAWEAAHEVVVPLDIRRAARRRAGERLAKEQERADRVLLGYLGSGYLEARKGRVS